MDSLNCRVRIFLSKTVLHCFRLLTLGERHLACATLRLCSQTTGSEGLPVFLQSRPGVGREFGWTSLAGTRSGQGRDNLTASHMATGATSMAVPCCCRFLELTGPDLPSRTQSTFRIPPFDFSLSAQREAPDD